MKVRTSYTVDRTGYISVCGKEEALSMFVDPRCNWSALMSMVPMGTLETCWFELVSPSVHAVNYLLNTQDCAINLGEFDQPSLFWFENERATHLLAVDSVQQLAVDEERLPTGRILDVSETSADFTQPRPAQSEPLDNSYVFNADGNVRPRARLSSDSMTLEVHSDQPVLQVYVSHDAATDETWVCLEPHGYVDATRHPEFESIVLYPNQLYRHCTRMCWRLNDSI